MGSYNNNINGWAGVEYTDFPYDLDEDSLNSINAEVFPPLEFYSIAKNAKMFLSNEVSYINRNIFQAASALKVPLSNLLSTFYSDSITVLAIAEEVITCGDIVKTFHPESEWWFVILTYKGIDFVLFNNRKDDKQRVCLTIKYSDFEMLNLIFPDVEFVLNPDESIIK